MKKIVLFVAAIFLLGANSFSQGGPPRGPGGGGGQQRPAGAGGAGGQQRPGGQEGQSQTGPNENKYRSLRDNLSKNEVNTQHPKKGIDPKTWMDRGKLFHDAYNVNVGFLRPGMPALEARLFFREPRQVLTSEDGTETFDYGTLKLYFENGALSTWEENQQSFNNPLAEATKAYQKAASLDVKGKNTKKINDAYRSISRDLESKLFNEYALSKYQEAYHTALQRVDVSKLLGFSDTTYYFFAGFMAHAQSTSDSSMWQQASENFERALALGYKESGESVGQIYHLLYEASINTGDSLKALKYAQTGFEMNPNYEFLMYDLINYYLARGENHKTLEYIEQAVAKDPKNANLLFAQGRVLDQLGEVEKSLVAYDAAIAADPTYFDPYYNKAVTYYNHAVKLMDEANDARTNAEFDLKKNAADDEFAKAIPLLEKALELRPDETSTLEVLRSLYFRLRLRSPEYEAKLNVINEKLGL